MTKKVYSLQMVDKLLRATKDKKMSKYNQNIISEWLIKIAENPTKYTFK